MNKLKHLGLLLIAAALPASADIQFSFQYDSSNRTAVVTESKGSPSSSTVSIPMQQTYNGIKYTVVGVEAGAMNDIAGMKTLIIPVTIKQIGTVRSGNSKAYQGGCLSNFLRCPDLEKISVETGNPTFMATGGGVLSSADGSQVYRIPPKMDVSSNSGTLKMSTTGVAIAKDAFEGNTTITGITFSKNLEYISPESGIQTMNYLRSFSIPSGGKGESFYYTDGSALINKSSKTVINYAPGAPAASYTLGAANATSIGRMAFANTVALKELTVSEGYKTMADYAFLNSSVTHINLPSTLALSEDSGKGAFRNSKAMKVNWNNTNDAEIPSDFMLDCANLTSFTMSTYPKRIGASAFRNCPKLETFVPFDGRTQLAGDSIWANTGLKEVVFDYAETIETQPFTLRATFSGCKELRKLDMSQLYLPSDRVRLTLGAGFAASCPMLEEVSLPGYVGFEKSSFYNTNSIKKLLIREFDADYKPIISIYSNVETHPECYVLVPEGGAGYFPTPVDQIFTSIGPATATPIFYFETIYPLLSQFAPYSVNYVPGATTKRYPEPAFGAQVEELFGFKLEDCTEYIDVQLTPRDFVKITRLRVNGDDVEIPSSGKIHLKPELRTMRNMTINFTVNGIPMETQYPSNLLPWDNYVGIQEDLYEEYQIAGSAITLPENMTATVYDLNGMEQLRISTGTVDLKADCGLRSGVYVLVIETTTETRIAKILI